MADEFDPYFKWLGIPPQEQPPNHYRLLSIPLFVDDGDVIAHAADRLMGHLRTFQTGKHSLASQKLLNEISAARLCLLNVQRKAAYDAELKAKLAPPPAPSAPVAPPPVAPQPATSVARPRPVVQSTPMPAPVPRPAPVEPLSGMTFDAPTARSKSRQARKSAARLPAWLVPAAIAAAVLAVVATVAIVMRSNSGAPQVAQKNLDGARPVEANPAEPSGAPSKPANPPQASWKHNLPFKTEPEKTQTAEPLPAAVVEPPQGVPTVPAPPPVARVEPPQPAPGAVPIPEPKATPGKAPFDAAQAHAYQEAWAKSLGVPVVAANSIGMKLVLIPPGEFQMGSSLVQIDTALNLTDAVEPLVRSEGPQHRVVITQPFLMGSTEVTIGHYRKYLEESPTVPANLRAELTQLVAQHKLTDDTPASHLGWQHAVGFCLWLSEREKLDKPYEGAGEDWQPLPGNGYHLPTEAQWEYACRAGTETMYSHGDDEAQLVDYGWLGRNCGTFPPRVAGTRKANPFGLFDMHGNLYEWCQDTYDPGFYSVSPVEDPFHSAPGNRVVRGGGYAYHPVHLRSANRHSHAANTTKSPLLGFRVVRGLAVAEQVRIPGKVAAAVNLLTDLDIDRDKVLGVWKREGEALITPSVTDARLQLPPPPAANYRVTAVVERVRGNDAFVMGLVVGGQQVASTIDATQPSRSGLANVDGKGSLYNDSKRLGAVLTTNNPYSIVHTVIDNHVVVSVNGQKIIDWTGDPKRLSLPPKLRVPDAAGLFLAANSAFRIKSLTVEPLGANANVDTMDALAKLNLPQDVVAGDWKLEGGALTSPPGIDSILLLPAPPAPDYRVTVEATRIGDHAINIGLLSGGRQFLAGIDYPQYNGSGLDLVDGKSIEFNETLRKGRWIGRDRPSVITCTVQGQRVLVTVDDNTIVDWTGAPERLSLFNGFQPFDKTRLFLCTHSAFKIGRITVEPLPPPGPGR